MIYVLGNKCCVPCPFFKLPDLQSSMKALFFFDRKCFIWDEITLFFGCFRGFYPRN